MCLSITIRICFAAFIISTASSAFSAERVFKQRSDKGGMIFSDSPIINGQIVRSSYQNQYGRPVASSSCLGLSADALAKRAKVVDEAIDTAALMHNVDANLVKAVAEVESCFDPKAVSKVGAQGIMQLMPGTAADLGVRDSFDVVQNIHGGTDYLAQMLKRFDNDQSLALAAYNAGPGAVEKHRGIPPFPETQDYVKKVLKIYSKSATDPS